MKKHIVITMLIIASGCVNSYAHTAKQEVKTDKKMQALEEQVKELIVKDNDYQAALKLYAAEARKQDAQEYYRNQYAILRRVIKMKKAMQAIMVNSAETSEQELKKWASYYQAVRAYYYLQGFYSEAVGLDKKALEVLKTEQARLNYIETLVVLNRNEDAKVCITQAAEAVKAKPVFRILELLIQARQPMSSEDISKQLKSIEFNPKDNPFCMVYSACIYQNQNNAKQACAQIVKALENTAPAQMQLTRKIIENMKEFQSLLQDEAYQAAMQTQSKVYQSGCTGGSSCSNCSMKDKCPSHQ